MEAVRDFADERSCGVVYRSDGSVQLNLCKDIRLLTEEQCDTEIRGKFVRRINESTRLKVTLEEDDNGNVHKELPSARMLSKMGCKRANVSEATRKFIQQKCFEISRK